MACHARKVCLMTTASCLQRAVRCRLPCTRHGTSTPIQTTVGPTRSLGAAGRAQVRGWHRCTGRGHALGRLCMAGASSKKTQPPLPSPSLAVGCRSGFFANPGTRTFTCSTSGRLTNPTFTCRAPGVYLIVTDGEQHLSSIKQSLSNGLLWSSLHM